MRYLILSDIHANWEALESVVKHAAGRYEQVLCCGDLIGYGADPNAVVAWVRDHASLVVRGNHDKASVGLEDLEWFNPVARSAALWTMSALTPENIEWVRSLPKGPVTLDSFEVFHGSPLDEDEYMLAANDASQIFSYLERPVGFFGHTHVQGGFILNHTRVETIGKPNARADGEELRIDPDCAYLINPGSVGQPRDGDPRAAYVVFDDENRLVFYGRPEYDVAKAQEKIVHAGLPPLLADRLAFGR